MGNDDTQPKTIKNYVRELITADMNVRRMGTMAVCANTTVISETDNDTSALDSEAATLTA